MALPPYLASTIHPFFCSVLLLDTDARVALVGRQYDVLKASLLPSAADGGAASSLDSGSGKEGASDVPLSQQQPGAPRSGGVPPSGVNPQLASSSSDGDRLLATGTLLSEAQATLQLLEGRGSIKSSRGSISQSTPRSTSSQAEEAGEERQPPRPEGRQERASSEEHGEAAAGSVLAASTVPSAPTAGCNSVAQVQQPQPQAHEGMVLVAVLLCTLLRGSRLQGHKARVVALLCDAAAHCDDETRLQRVLPYLIAAVAEPLAAVKCVALRAVARVLAQVSGAEVGTARVGSAG